MSAAYLLATVCLVLGFCGGGDGGSSGGRRSPNLLLQGNVGTGRGAGIAQW